jgi:chromosome segregation ATPase
VIILAFINLRAKAEQSAAGLIFSEKLEQLRREFGGTFVPVSVDSLQHASIHQRLEAAERLLERTRDSVHLMNNRFTELIMGKLDAMKNQLEDQSRKSDDIRDKFGAVEGMMHDFARRIEHLERRPGA